MVKSSRKGGKLWDARGKIRSRIAEPRRKNEMVRGKDFEEGETVRQRGGRKA